MATEQKLAFGCLCAHGVITWLLFNYLALSLGRQTVSAFQRTDQQMVDVGFGKRLEFVRAIKQQTAERDGILIVTESYWPFVLAYEVYPRRIYRISPGEKREPQIWANRRIQWIAEINDADERWFSLRRLD